MNKTPCIYCTSTQHSFCYATHDTRQVPYNLHRCNDCGTYFLCPYPTDEDLAWAYSDAYYGNQTNKFDNDTERVVDIFRQYRAAWVAKRVAKNAKILDIGCGNGRFLHFLVQKGNFEGHGIELPGKSADRAAQLDNINLHVGALQPDTFAPQSFDAVTLVHVYEHLPNPRQTLETLQKIVKPGGKLFIYLPNIDSFQSRWFKGLWLHLDPPRHLFLQAPVDLIRHCRSYGFEVAEKQFFNPEYNPFGMQQSLLNMVYAKRELLYEHLKGNQQYTADYAAWHLIWQKWFFRLTFPLFIATDFIAALFGKSATFVFVFEKK